MFYGYLFAFVIATGIDFSSEVSLPLVGDQSNFTGKDVGKEEFPPADSKFTAPEVKESSSIPFAPDEGKDQEKFLVLPQVNARVPPSPVSVPRDASSVNTTPHENTMLPKGTSGVDIQPSVGESNGEVTNMKQGQDSNGQWGNGVGVKEGDGSFGGGPTHPWHDDKKSKSETGGGYDESYGEGGYGKAGGGGGGSKGGLGIEAAVAAGEDQYLVAGHALSDQHQLYNDLFKQYNKHIRPIISHDDIIKVHFEIALFNVLSVNSKTGVMETNSEVIMKWHDPYLMWDPAYYNDTKTLRVLYEDVWHPDVILFNTADANYEASLIHTNIIVNYEGECKLLIHAVFKSVCDIDIQWFPFDQQTCDMVFSSWTADVHQMVLIEGPSDISRFVPNHEFFLENFYSDHYEDFNPCCTEPFSMISYHIQLQRRVKFALFFFIVPGILINVCALLVFSLPAETGEKVGLGINSMLAMMVFLMAVTENLPPTETLPLAGVYYGVCLIVLTFNIAFSVYVLNLSYSGERGNEVPVWMRMITVFMAKMVCLKIPKFLEEQWELNKGLDMIKEKVTPFNDQVHMMENIQNIRVEPHTITHPSTPIKDPIQRRQTEALEGMFRIMTAQANVKKKDEKASELIEQWKYLSRVLDRFLFFVFGTVTFLFNIIILTQSPFSEQFEYCPLGAGMCSDGYDFKGVAPTH